MIPPQRKNGSPRHKVEIAERRKKVLAGLLAGMRYQLMAEKLEVCRTTIVYDVRAILATMEKDRIPDTDKYRRIEIERLDVALNAIWREVQQGNLKAIDRLISLQNQRAKYIPHLQDPEKFEVTGKDGKDFASAPIILYMPDNGRPDKAN